MLQRQGRQVVLWHGRRVLRQRRQDGTVLLQGESWNEMRSQDGQGVREGLLWLREREDGLTHPVQIQAPVRLLGLFLLQDQIQESGSGLVAVKSLRVGARHFIMQLFKELGALFGAEFAF